MDFAIPGTDALGQPRIGSIYDKVGTPDTNYQETGPSHCEDCLHKVSSDAPYCIHPKVVADDKLQDRLVMVDDRPTIKIDLEKGWCAYFRRGKEDHE
jgi:hypothetical protein